MKKCLLPFWGMVLILCIISCDSAKPDTEMQSDRSLLLPTANLPDYEADIDHAQLIANLDGESKKNGQRIYSTTCYNCHGNPDQPGSIPNAFRFWADIFKYGKDPYSIYQVLTQGFGRMPPQVQLVPKEKYDVIHFLREEYLKENNTSQYVAANSDYIATLPKGSSLGPEAKEWKPWAEMDYGDFFINTYELAGENAPEREISGGPSPLPNENYNDLNFAYKGIAIRLDKGKGGVAAGKSWALFDHDLMRMTGFWTGEGFIDWEGILLNDRHNIYPRTVGKVQVENPVEPAWANPANGSFDDPRFRAVDGRPFGPLPRDWTHYKGLYHYEDKTIISYTVGDATVLELYDLEQETPQPVMSRTLNIGISSKPLRMKVAPRSAAVKLIGEGVNLSQKGDTWILEVAANKAVNVKLLLAKSAVDLTEINASPPESLSKYTKGGPIHYPQILESPIIQGESSGAYVVDVLSLPIPTPWKSRMRPGGIDFIPNSDKALLCTIEGEVWEISGITQTSGTLKWRRIATGLYQPLGIKYHEGEIFVTCRDQLVRLNDLNGDGETDFYESFNNDHQVTEHFHEFAMGLQTDDDGNFYYAKSARHARTPLVPQHGTLLRVSSDGQKTDIVANGFRAANGVCYNPDGTFFVTDQEGHWNPMNRINHVKEGGFYGNMYGYGAGKDTSDAAMISPLVWVDSKNDRSPSELVWASSEKWGPLSGHLLNLSYGYGKIFAVLPEKIGSQEQAGIVEIPIPQFPTGIMRARFHPNDGQMYACGMNAWGSSQVIQAGGLYRIRYNNKPLNLPVKLNANVNGLQIEFSDPLDKKAAIDPANFEVKTWELKRTHNYGSKRYNTQIWEVDRIGIDDAGKTLMIHLPEIIPAWVVEVTYQLKDVQGESFEGYIQETIYVLGSAVAVR